MFSCKVCAEKDNRITELKHQISMLEKLVFPPRPTQDITVAEIESDKLFEPESHPVSDDDREAAALLTGSYDEPHGM